MIYQKKRGNHVRRENNDKKKEKNKLPVSLTIHVKLTMKKITLKLVLQNVN